MIDGELDDLVVFVERPSSELYALKILQEPYLGVIYTYGSVKLTEDEANDNLIVKFNYTINEVPEGISAEQLRETKDFKNYIGDILIKLLEDKVQNDQLTDLNT